MNDAACSFSGARTFLDTNLVLVSGPTAYEFSGVFMLSDRGLRPNWLPDVLHEGIHHWCLHSSVGLALAVGQNALIEDWLRSDARRAGIRHARHRGVVDALRPVLEGLACYGEFDLFPGHGNVRVEPLLWADLMLGDNYGKVGHQSHGDEQLREFLSELRLRRDFIAERKDSLAALPLDGIARGGYVLGYLLMRGLERRLVREFGMGLDSEQLLAFVRAWVFFDYDLAARILAEPDELDVQDVLQRLCDRIVDLATRPDLADLITRFDAAHRPGMEATRDDEARAALCTDPDAYERFSQLRERQAERINSRLGGSGQDEELIDFVRALYHDDRDWICVSSVPCRLAITNGRIALHPHPDDDATAPVGVPLFAGPPARDETLRAALDLTVDEVDGWCEAWVSSQVGAMLLAASDSGTHWVQPLFLADVDRAANFIRHHVANHTLVERNDHVRSLVRDNLAQQPWHDGLAEHVTDAVDQAVEIQTLVALGLLECEPRGRALLEEGGLYAVLGRNRDLVRTTVSMGLLQSCGIDEAPEHGITRDAVEHMREVIAAHGDIAGVQLADTDVGRIWI